MTVSFSCMTCEPSNSPFASKHMVLVGELLQIVTEALRVLGAKMVSIVLAPRDTLRAMLSLSGAIAAAW